MNNNNTYNRYFVVGASESFFECDSWFEAEQSFFENKHGSVEAQRIHNHPSIVKKMATTIKDGSYTPEPCYCFPVFEPTPREIFASFCPDRLVHHYVAPFIDEIAETVHKLNGNVSHGNRKGCSAHTAAEQIRDWIERFKTLYDNPYVVKIDIRSFFASIPREKAYKALARYAEKYYTKPDKTEKLVICRRLILHDPTVGCVEMGGNWERVPSRKRLKNAKPGNGLPIGNFYSQLVANLYLAELDSSLVEYGVHPRFVDDKCLVVKDKDTAIKSISTAKDTLKEIGLELHPDKIYIQPATHGVNFCGRTVKNGRIYLSNRTIGRCKQAIMEAEPNVEGARSVCNTVNSYLGLMCHCTEYKNQEKIVELLLGKFSEWCIFIKENGKYKCVVKKKYTKRSEHFQNINKLMNLYDETRKIHKRNIKPRRSRRWTRGWR